MKLPNSFTDRFRKKGPKLGVQLDKIQVTQIYKLQASDLQKFFDHSMSTTERTTMIEEQHQGISGLLNKLQSEAGTGIMGDERDLNRRKSFFGENSKPEPVYPPFLDSVKDAMSDRILQCVAGLGLLSIITGMIQSGWKTGWQQGASIIGALLILVLIQSWNDWAKDKQFVKLANRSKDEDVTVVRGKLGAMQRINIWDLVVGDIVILHAGDKIPSDCIAIEAVNLEVQESYAGNLATIEKGANDPFLRADSFILKGHVRAVVACVGFQSTREQQENLELREDTPLQNKLFNLSQSFTYIGLWAALAILIASVVILIIQTGVDENVGAAIFTGKFVDSLILAFVIILVAIPEGLPVTVGISLAYSLDNMYNKDKILVRQLDANEKMGEVTHFILGKTGTLTTQDMNVTNFFVQPTKDKMMHNNRHDTVINCAMPENVRRLIQESVIYNNGCHIEITEDSFYVPVGNGTEVSLLKWLQKADVPVHKLITIKESAAVKTHLEFNSELKYSMIAIQHEEGIRVYAKGAPEIVLAHCHKKFDEHGDNVDFDEDERNAFLNGEMTEQCSNGLRCIAFSYADFSNEDFEEILSRTENLKQVEDFIKFFERGVHTFVTMISLRDELRSGVCNAIEVAQNDGGINVLLVSGDNLETAKRMAVDSGIMSAADLYDDSNPKPSNKYAMTAEEFIEVVGTEETVNEDGVKFLKPRDHSSFLELMETLKIIGRAKPIHKQVISAGLQELGKKVAVIGEGISDLNAFQTADVSFAMGTGKSIARNKASYVLLDDNFQSCIKALCRGRNIYSNVKRFLQFQITVNFSILVCVLVGIISLQESPFNPIMLIWINLIMDVLAALALATAPPLDRVIHEPAISKEVPILQAVIWRQIYGITIWNLIIMMIVMFFGNEMFGYTYTPSDSYKDNTIAGHAKAQHYTVIFNTFVFLQLFNQINCRVVGPRDFNVFTSFFSNWIFILITMIIFAVQYLSSMTGTYTIDEITGTVSVSGQSLFMGLFQTATIEQKTFWTTFVWGSTVIAISFLLKLTPQRFIEKIPIRINEDEALGADSKIVGMYAKATNAKKGDGAATVNGGNADADDSFQQAV